MTTRPNRSESAEPFPCASCGSALPIEVCADCDEAVNIACAFCGARYRGFVTEPGPEARAENVFIFDQQDP